MLSFVLSTLVSLGGPVLDPLPILPGTAGPLRVAPALESLLVTTDGIEIENAPRFSVVEDGYINLTVAEGWAPIGYSWKEQNKICFEDDDPQDPAAGGFCGTNGSGFICKWMFRRALNEDTWEYVEMRGDCNTPTYGFERRSDPVYGTWYHNYFASIKFWEQPR